MAERENPPPLAAGAVDNLLRLAALGIGTEEKARLERELGRIIELIGVLRGVDTDGVAPLAHPLEAPQLTEAPHLPDAPQPLREDEVTEAVDRERLQQGAPAVRDGLYMVPRVVE